MKDRPKNLLRLYQLGSFLVLLFCLTGAAIFFARSFLHKEENRSKIFLSQLNHFFEFQYRTFSEEMWTGNFESISMHIKDIAQQLGNADYRLHLANTEGLCVYSAESNKPQQYCDKLPEYFSSLINATSPSTELIPVVKFDQSLERYIYMVPLYVGPIHKGYLYVSLSDPYHFFKGHYLALAGEMFWFSIVIVLLVWLTWLIASRHFLLRPHFQTLLAYEKQEALSRQAAQLAHDIQSPLVSLTSMVESSDGIPAEERKLLKAAASRITNLAQDLLKRYKNQDRAEDNFTFVSWVVKSILAEKATLTKNQPNISLLCNIPPAAKFVGVKVSETDLSRVLSNLVNNSLQAMESLTVGSITIQISEPFLKNNTQMIKLSVADTGRGMDSDTLGKLRTSGGSYGKSMGHGMGLSHAKEFAQSIEGTLLIDSVLERGTTITLELPLAPEPQWLATEVHIEEGDQVVILDDDESVHLLWRSRLKEKNCVFLQNSDEFDLKLYPPHKCRYVFDYEINGSSKTGLDLISTYHLGSRAILVTSYFNDLEIQEKVQAAGAKLLPKFMIPDIPISQLDESAKNSLGSSHYDMVLIEDNEAIRNLWKYGAKKKGLHLLACVDEGEFLNFSVPHDTPIYIDQRLNDGILGVNVARTLHNRGYKNIYLATSDDIGIEDYPFLKAIVDKSFPLGARTKNPYTDSNYQGRQSNDPSNGISKTDSI